MVNIHNDNYKICRLTMCYNYFDQFGKKFLIGVPSKFWLYAKSPKLVLRGANLPKTAVSVSVCEHWGEETSQLVKLQLLS